mmetsp:Transcript_9159/g.16632  ORF Transcript_9159/g.16632 Transcript_9159/m.16632 type:complete len:210 (-) Transcript_9159:52-681(-)
MHANDFVINDSATGKAIKGIAKLLPKFDREATTAFIVESVDPVDSSTFVVPTKNKEVFRIFDLIRKQKAHHLQTLLSTIHIISQKQVVCLGRKSTVFKEPEKVRVLPVNVTANFNGRTELQKHGLTEQHFPCLVAQGGGIGDSNFHRCSWLLVSCREECINYSINPGFIRRILACILPHHVFSLLVCSVPRLLLLSARCLSQRNPRCAC